MSLDPVFISNRTEMPKPGISKAKFRSSLLQSRGKRGSLLLKHSLPHSACAHCSLTASGLRKAKMRRRPYLLVCCCWVPKPPKPSPVPRPPPRPVPVPVPKPVPNPKPLFWVAPKSPGEISKRSLRWREEECKAFWRGACDPPVRSEANSRRLTLSYRWCRCWWERKS